MTLLWDDWAEMPKLENLLILFVCIGIGALLKRTRKLSAAGVPALNSVVMNVCLPALILLHFHEMKLETALLYPALMAWILFALGLLFFFVLLRFGRIDLPSFGALVMTAGLANTSFVGFPLLEAMYGPEALKTGIVVDQFGSFLVLAVLGTTLCSHLARRGSDSGTLRRILTFTPIHALWLALLLRPFPYPEAWRLVLQRLGDVLIPLALISVGLQLRFDARELKDEWKNLLSGLFFKLFLGPALIAFLYLAVLGLKGREIEITIVEAAMAPMITGAIMAADHGLNPRLANLMIAVGIPLSLVTVPLWSGFLSALAR